MLKAQGISSKREETNSAKVQTLDGNEKNDAWKRKVESPPKKEAPKKQNTVKCFFCNASHPLERCNKLLKMPLEKRMEILKKDGRCYRCLEKKDHIAKDCNSEGCKCDDCHQNHPTILCGLRQLMQKRNQERMGAAPNGGARQPPHQRNRNNGNSNNATSSNASTTGSGSAQTTTSTPASTSATPEPNNSNIKTTTSTHNVNSI